MRGQDDRCVVGRNLATGQPAFSDTCTGHAAGAQVRKLFPHLNTYMLLFHKRG